MFHLFTDKAIKTIMQAQEEARQLGHNYVGTGQILTGLCLVPCASKEILKASGLSLMVARDAVKMKEGKGDGFVAVEIPFTDCAKRALELAWHVAQQRHDDFISSEHLLLGLIALSEDTAYDLISEHCGSCDSVKAAVEKRMS